LYGWGEVFQNAPPGAFVTRSPSVTFINDDEVEEVGGIVTEFRGGITFFIPSSHEGLENGKKDTAIFGDSTPFFDDFRVNADEGIVREGRERVIGLVG
jgi:hypothetical protein